MVGRVINNEPMLRSAGRDTGSTSPDAQPYDTIKPNRARQFSEPSKVYLPTLSKTKLTPLPSVSVLTCSTKSSDDESMAYAQPFCSTRRCFSVPRTPHIPLAPDVFNHLPPLL